MYSPRLRGRAEQSRATVGSGSERPLCDAGVSTVLPPVLLSTLTARPERDLPYPICRYIVPAGEAFPASLVEPWSRGRRQPSTPTGPLKSAPTPVANYCVLGTCHHRQSLPGRGLHHLESDTLSPLQHGEEGALHWRRAAGAGLPNLPQVTAARFIDHPSWAALPNRRSLHIDPHSLRVHFHGRMDAQLKVRGYRVEAQPIESLLQDRFSEIETAVLDCQNDELIALIRAPSLLGDRGAPANVTLLEHPLVHEAQQLLEDRFPPYAVPSRFFIVDQFELLASSGKIDRRALPRVGVITTAGRGYSAESASTGPADDRDLPDSLLALCREALGPGLGWHDDFVEWGAQSIAKARLTQNHHEKG